MTIQIRSVTITVFIIVAFCLLPIWVILPIILGAKYESRTIGISLMVFFFGLTIIIAHKVSSKTTEVTVTDKDIHFRKTTLQIDSIQYIIINRSAIGMSAIEFYLKSGKKHSLNVPNYKGNSELAISFIKKSLPAMKFFDKVLYY
jgi:hypothetical protein